MRTAVIYKSKYGAAKTYAKWIAEALDAELMDADKVKSADLQKFEAIVYGGGIYAGGVNGIALIKDNFESIGEKPLYIFTVGISDVKDSENIRKIRDSLCKVLTHDMVQKIKVYHFTGTMKYSEMGFMHRSMMKMMIKMLQKKPRGELREEDKRMIDSFGKDVDFTDIEAITPLVEDVKKGTGKH